MMANRNVLTFHRSVESLIMVTERLRIIAGVNEHLRLIRAGIFSAALYHQSPQLWHLVTPGDQGKVSRSSEAETIILCCLRPGGHPAGRRTSGVSWKWKSDGGGEQHRVICNFLDVYKLPRQQVGGSSLTPYSLILSLLFVEMVCGAQLWADARAIGHCHITWLRKKD